MEEPNAGAGSYILVFLWGPRLSGFCFPASTRGSRNPLTPRQVGVGVGGIFPASKIAIDLSNYNGYSVHQGESEKCIVDLDLLIWCILPARILCASQGRVAYLAQFAKLRRMTRVQHRPTRSRVSSSEYFRISRNKPKQHFLLCFSMDRHSDGKVP